MKLLKPAYADRAPLDTPYAKARAEWDDRMGAPAVHAFYWRVVAFSLLVPLSISIAGNIYLSRAPKVVPVYIAIDKLGQAGVLTGVDTAASPDDSAIAYHLREFVEQVRRISTDPALNKRGWIRAYWFATAHGREMLTTYLGPFLDRPELRAEKGIVTVDVETPLKITAGSWQVDWKEQQWDVSGRSGSLTRWRGTFRIRISPPTKRQDAVQNPIGMFVDEFNWVELH